MTLLNEQIAMITGASRGIGLDILSTLGQAGAFVIGTATTQRGADDISTFIEREGLSGMSFVLNVTSILNINHVFEVLTSENKLPTILVNNAGITQDNLLLRMEDEEWNAVIDTNLSSVYRMTKTFIKPMFRKRYGRIINIGSVVGHSGNSGQTNYCASKAGLVGFTKSLAQEIGSRGITVNVVSPGFIQTDMTDKLPDMVKEEMLKRIPLRKMGLPIHIAKTVLFLASEGADYITGETIHVNGGLYMA